MGIEKRKGPGGQGGFAKKPAFAQNQKVKGEGQGKFQNQKKPFLNKPQQQGQGSKGQGLNQVSPQSKPNFKNQNAGKKQSSANGAANEVPSAPQSAKKMEVQVVKSESKNQTKQNKPQGKNFQKPGLNKVSDNSKGIFKKPAKKNRFQRIYNQMDSKVKVRSPGECERAQKAEQELVHSGRAFTVKVSDPPITQDVVKAWSSGIETAVFTRPVEARQFLVIFKHNANIKKELENLKKVTFAGGKVQVDEKIDRGSEVGANPEGIDPYSLYVSNLNESVTKEALVALFPKAKVVTPPRKHNPKLGSATKFAFINFDSADDALASFKENYQAVLNGNSIVMRFRRVAAKELHNIAKSDTPQVATVTPKKGLTPKSPASAAKRELMKVEPKVEDNDDQDEDDESDDDEDELDVEEGGSDDDGNEQDEDDDGDDDEEDDDDDDDDDEAD